MATNEIRIVISAPQQDVFEYTLEPKNTSKWIYDVSEETVDTKQIGLGTIYSNEFGQLEVTDYERNKFFELTDQKTSYQCSYSYHKIDDNTTELVYFEAMQDGSELKEPMNKKNFETLKELLENN